MKIHWLQFSIATCAFFSLFSLYLIFLGRLFPVLAESLGGVEIAIFSTLVLRVLFLAILPALRKLPSLAKIIVFSLEIFIMLAFMAAYVLTGSAFDYSIISMILSTWVASSFYILLPYFVAELAFIIYRGEKMLSSLTWGILLLGDLNFAVNFAIVSGFPSGNLIGLGRAMISDALDPKAFGSLVSFSNLYVEAAEVAFFVTLLAFVAHSRGTLTNYQGKYSFGLLIVLIGNFSLIVWILLAPLGGLASTFWMLSIPSVCLSTLLMVAFRGRRE